MAEIEENIRRSEEVQDIIGKVPSWIVRAGSYLVFIFFILLILVGWLIKYPDIVSGKIIITCQNPPATLVARSAGRVHFLIKENQQVVANEYIAIVENISDIKEIDRLKQNLPQYNKFALEPYAHLQENLELNFYSLGDIQETFNEFKSAVDEYLLFFNIKFNTEKIKGYTSQLKHLTEEIDLLNKKKTVLTREFQIHQRQHDTNKKMFLENAISQFDLDKSENELNQSAYILHQLEDDVLKNVKSIDEIKSKINELLISDKDQITKLDFKIKLTLKQLNVAFLSWEKKYVLIAPISGQVTFYEYWNNNQYIDEGSEVAHIVSGSSDIFGKLYTKGKKMGKVKEGQKVRIKLDNYPSSEYGVVFGEVQSVSAINKDNTYLINVILPKGLITNYHEKIIFNHEMAGEADIITDKLSIIERFFYQTRRIYSNNL